jgi:c-di-GMP-binding flagellar brake protein YcgR
MSSASHQFIGEQRPERRSHPRYPVVVEVEYSVLRGDEAVKTARGWTVDISSGGVLFEADDVLPEGTRIEFSVAWPARLDNDVRLELCASGRVVRRDSNRTAVRIERPVFRTRSNGKVPRR